MKGLLVIALFIALCAAVPTQLIYTLNTNYVYNVSGVVQNNGYDTATDDFLPGYYSLMQSTMVMQAIKEDDTSYTFAMNLFGTVVSVSDNSSSASPSKKNGDSLGEDMYFVQLKTGQIIQILYSNSDSIYYVDVKLSVINAFQTAIVNVGASLTVVESDPVGNHSAQITGAAGSDGSLTLTKEFSQSDFSAFPDPTVNAQNMYIEAEAVTGVHASGYIMGSNLNQYAVLTNGNPATAFKREVTNNATGFNMQLSAIGSLSVQNIPNSLYATKTFSPMNTPNVITTTMYDYAVQSSALAKIRAATILDVPAALDSLFSKNRLSLPALKKIGNHFKYNPQDITLLASAMQSEMLLETVFRDRVFFVLTVAQNEALLIKYGLNSQNCEVVMRATLAAAHFQPSDAINFALTRIAQQQQCAYAQGSAQSILAARPNAFTQYTNVKASDFPFNKSITENVTLGGKVAAVQFAADLFVGTNLNCNTPQFNYEGSAEGSATAVLFGYSQQAFDAKIIYGQENGSPLADTITLSVWGNVVYNQAIPVVACQAGNYPLGHTAPGFSVEHTLWVSIIPITFSASADLELAASWAWNVCPTQLEAEIEVTGQASIALSGSTFTDLLLLRAGFDLEGAFETAIIPQAYIHGTACQVGFEIDANNQPLNAEITSYYQWKKCKFLFFDCKWGNHNTQTWWSWSEPAKDLVLYKFTYDIQL